MPDSRSDNRIALTANVVEWDAGMDPAPCLVGMIHARSSPKPRMPRLGTEQMRYMRSRPWRSRGPWFDNRAGARRRGRRSDELVAAVSDELHVDGGVVAADLEATEAQDVVLPMATAWPIHERMPTAWLAHERTIALAPSGSGHDRALQPIDQLAEAVIAARMLSSRSEESASSDSSSRQSA